MKEKNVIQGYTSNGKRTLRENDFQKILTY